MDMMLWNIVLSFLSGLFLWGIKLMWDEMQRIQILLNRTREEVAKEYVTRADVHMDMGRIIDRLDRLEAKLDTFMKEQRSAIN